MNGRPELPQLTARAIVLGAVLSIVLASANAYLGLFAGLTVSASIPAAVISMAVLRLFRDSNILENNIVQTGASAGESLAAGVIFTLPALVILDYWQVFDYWWVTIIAGLGGLLGVLFTVPLRRSLIVEQALAFPEGKATAEVLKVGEGGSRDGVTALALAGVAGALMKVGSSGLRLWSETAAGGLFVGRGIAYVGTNLSPALLSVGYIVGPNIATVVFAGGAISWYFAIPWYSVFLAAGDPAVAPLIAGGASAVEVADQIWSAQVRYLGVGAMLVGGVWALISLRGSLLSVVKAGLASFRAGERREVPHYERDMPMPLVLGGVVLSVVPIFFAYNAISEDFGPAVTVPMTLIMVAAAFLFSSVAAYMAGLVGSSNNPISGVTIATILLSAVLLSGLVSVTGASAGPAAAILIGAVVASAAAIGGDNMQDLKAGYLLGATPWRQQVMQIVGVLSAVLFMAPILNLLLEAYGIGVPTERHPHPLIAPQAALMASVARGVFAGGLPWNMVIAGAVLGAAIILFDEWLGRRGAGWRAPVLAVAVGIYLPLELTVPILAGGLIAALVERTNRARADAAAAESRRRIGTLMAAGLITGEAIMGILLAIPIVASGDRDVLAIAAEPLGGLPGLLALAAIAYWLYRRVTRAPAG